jgi:hypothetical protein
MSRMSSAALAFLSAIPLDPFSFWRTCRRAAVASAALLVCATPVALANGSLCGGRSYDWITAPHGASPYIRLIAKGATGAFLVDFGSTASSLAASVFSKDDEALAFNELSLPGFSGAQLTRQHYNFPVHPPGGQLGILGTDLLSRLTVQFAKDKVFLGERPCSAKILRAHGLVPISQRGFFGRDRRGVDPHRPNVPIVYVALGSVKAWAQIDTGYDDLALPHSIDINQALFDRLVAAGTDLRKTSEIQVDTCEGLDTRPVYAAPGQKLAIENGRGESIIDVHAFSLIVKSRSHCGGIASISVPAAQLSASFLRLFDDVVFEPQSAEVWLKPARKK